ncbi:MAG: GAF domain-containing protein [Nitrospirae bacterium]|nr:GAF domain-containing protein [Nitrospirota bacterium]
MQKRRSGRLTYKIGAILVQDDVAFDDKLQHVVSALSSYFKAEKCSIMIINPDDLTLEVKAATNPALIGLKRRLSDVTISTRALLDDVPFHADKRRLSFFMPADCTKYASCHSLSIPIKYQNKKIGVLNLTDSKNSRRLTKRQEALAVEIIEHLAIYIYAAQTKELLERKIKKFEDAMTELMRLDELKTSLTSFIVHDLKGPISTIMANLDMMSYEPLAPQQFEYVNLALTDVYRMQRMVMNILDVLKLEEGKIKIFREETDIYTLAKREMASFKNLLSMRNIEIMLEGNSHLCYIDENLIGRAISNLLINAIEHSPDRKEIVLRIQYDAAEKETVVSVSDRGIGIPDELKGKIFDKFFQVEEGKMQRKTTTGLGLTFCKLVVNAHGGDIRVEDAEEGGARFVFTLPETLKEVIS